MTSKKEAEVKEGESMASFLLSVASRVQHESVPLFCASLTSTVNMASKNCAARTQQIQSGHSHTAARTVNIKNIKIFLLGELDAMLLPYSTLLSYTILLSYNLSIWIKNIACFSVNRIVKTCHFSEVEQQMLEQWPCDQKVISSIPSISRENPDRKEN